MMVTSWIIVISSKHIKIKERTTSRAMVFDINTLHNVFCKDSKECESEYTWRSVDRPLKAIFDIAVSV